MSRLFLAPMEGVTDWVMRDLLTQMGGIDQCVTEFLRVTTQLHSKKVFYKWCPELHTHSRTRNGTPVFVQLLGGHAEPLALNAARAAELGALGIDLNFGCPAKTVNRHDGGASLLKCPERIFSIVKTVRASVPANIPVTVKIRLGWDDPSACLETSVAACEGGASWLTVHCRTKMDGYRPPAHWEWIPRIQEKITIPVIANGDIGTVKDFLKCQEVSGAEQFMIGRAALMNPHLFLQIKNHLGAISAPGESSEVYLQPLGPLIMNFYSASRDYINEHFATARTKQWLKQLSLKQPLAKEVFDAVKAHKKPAEFYQGLEKHICLFSDALAH
jgi:tRNA-dihydrouridine synthase C